MGEKPRRLRLIPPIILLGLILAATALHFLWDGWPAFSFPWAGGPLIAVGVLFVLWVNRLFKRAGTTIRPHDSPSVLVEHGPFRFSRNPIYLGAVLGLLGLALVVGTLPYYAAPILMFAVLHMRFIPVEESNLAAAIGQPYLDYKARVRRWV